MTVINLSEEARRAAFEKAVMAKYPTLGPGVVRRRDMQGSPRFGQYVALHVEEAWQFVNATLTNLEPKCSMPPDGLWCSRKAGHDGPCATRRVAP